MSENLGTIYYTVDADTGNLLRSTQDADRSLDRLQGGMDRTDGSAQRLSGGMKKLAGAIAAVIAASALRDMATMVQQYQEMAERVQMATGSTEEFEMVQKRLMATADGTFRSLAEAQELYIRTADSLRSMGYETSAAMDVQDSLSYAFVTNATEAGRAQAAISAFSKSMNTGKVAADQWETILNAVPSVIDDIAEASGKSAQAVRKLGAEGKLTARDLSGGLLESLDANKEAASKMANTMVDAGVRAKNAFTVILVALEDQTGALDTFTNGIIKASEYLLAFGADAEAMATFLETLKGAAIATAAVIGGRMVMALAASTSAFYANNIVARAKAVADLAAARNGAALAAQQLIVAQTTAAATVGFSTNAAALTALTAAQARATGATATLSAAQTVMSRTAGVATVAVRGLNTVMAFLGGPAGLFLLAAAAAVIFYQRLKSARQPIIDVTTAVGDLNAAQRDLAQLETARSLQETSDKLQRLQTDYGRMQKLIDDGMVRPSAEMAEGQARARVEIQALNDELATQRQRLADLRAFKPADGATGGGGAPPPPTESEEGQKSLASLRDQIALTKVQGAARARLTIIQKLGSEATDEERAEAQRLVTELYRIEEAQKAAEVATAEGAKASEAAAEVRRKAAEDAAEADRNNTETLAALREQIYQVSLSAEALAERQAELSLNKYATPQQIEEVRALAAELYNARQAADDLASRRAEFGNDTGGAIRGEVDPLSGGAFDDQTARYEAEEAAERERYAGQMERLAEAKDLQLEMVGGYQALELQMAQEHADRLAQIESAKQQVMLAAGEQAFGAVADVMKLAFGEQSAMYKAAFIAQKLFAIAQSAVAIQQGIALAAANPWPLNLGAMASVAAATAGLISGISSISMGGGRQYGGAVSPGSMHRINENGAPEIFNAANGQQFMLPNRRGDVVSNSDATSGASGGGGAQNGVNVRIENRIDVDGLSDALATSGSFERTIVNIITANSSTLKQALA